MERKKLFPRLCLEEAQTGEGWEDTVEVRSAQTDLLLG